MSVSAIRWALTLALGLALGAAWWMWPSEDAARSAPADEATSAAEQSAPSEPGLSPTAQAATVAGSAARIPAVRISDKGRLRVGLDALREGDVLALGLDLPDESRGSSPRPTKVIDPDGRVLEIEATALEGAGTGLRLEIEPDWLEPGIYMIQVETADQSHFPIRRYVLEVVR